MDLYKQNSGISTAVSSIRNGRQARSKILDDVDVMLIKELHKDGRRSNAALAKQAGVAEGTIRNRLKRLIKNNVIQISGLPNLPELGYRFVGIMGLQVKMQDLREVAKHLAGHPNICYLAFVTGQYDLLAIIITRSPEELSSFIEKEISALPSVLRSETFVNLDIIKGKGARLDVSGLIDSMEAVPRKTRA